MRKYALFAGGKYYPRGGWNDFRGAFPDVESAKAAYWWQAGAICKEYGGSGWGHIVWIDSMEVVLALPKARVPEGLWPVEEIKNDPILAAQVDRLDKTIPTKKPPSTKMLAEAFDVCLKTLDATIKE